MSLKYQHTLPEDLAAELKQEAARLGVPLAELIRETMRERLCRQAADEDGDALASITGIAEGPETDLASRVDHILYR